MWHGELMLTGTLFLLWWLLFSCIEVHFGECWPNEVFLGIFSCPPKAIIGDSLTPLLGATSAYGEISTHVKSLWPLRLPNLIAPPKYTFDIAIKTLIRGKTLRNLRAWVQCQWELWILNKKMNEHTEESKVMVILRLKEGVDKKVACRTSWAACTLCVARIMLTQHSNQTQQFSNPLSSSVVSMEKTGSPDYHN